MRRPEKSIRSIADRLRVEYAGEDFLVTGMTHASSDVEPGDLFLAFPGAKTHGALFAREAIARGAVAVLTDGEGARMLRNDNMVISTLEVPNPRRTAGSLSAWFYDEPMRDMFTVGITGTNGKTTTTTLLYQIWSNADRESGLIGTVETRIGKDVLKSQRTTPESSDLQALAAAMRERHIRNLAMEVSSHAIALERIRGSHFSAVAFTNLSQDHLDFHATMEDYFLVKAALFTHEYADMGLVNVDDAFGQRLIGRSQIPIRALSRRDPKADWSYASAFAHRKGYDIVVRGPGGILIEGQLPLHGEYNLDNALMAIALAYESGVNPIEIAAILPALTGAQGRLEAVDLGQNYGAFVDYAHSPDAVSRVLEACRSMSPGRIIAVLGCGGDRDASKRVGMGSALLEGSDIAIFTSDNPRSEDPVNILNQMTSGLRFADPSRVIADRKEAIEYAVAHANEGDVVVVLGKGHEKGQEINGVMTPFDDRQVLAEAIEGHS